MQRQTEQPIPLAVSVVGNGRAGFAVQMVRCGCHEADALDHACDVVDEIAEVLGDFAMSTVTTLN